MKQIIFVIICIILTGCIQDKSNNDDYDLVRQYEIYKKELVEQTEFQDGSDEFAIKVIVNKIDDQKKRYDIIIDTPKINMYHLQAIAKVEQDDTGSLPNLGILENDIFSLVPNNIDKSKGIYKGVNLSGISEKDELNVVVYLTFYRDENSQKKEERFIRLYGDEIR